MRVIAGKAKGAKLFSPKKDKIRPTLDRIRESLFSIICDRIPEARFLDLYAGTGSNGIEALSRGATYCAFVDNSVQSLDLVKKNLEKTRLSTMASMHNLVLPRALHVLKAKEEPFDVIFADPPFEHVDYRKLLEKIDDESLLAEDGMLIIEHSSSTPIESSTGGLQLQRSARYGDVSLSFFA